MSAEIKGTVVFDKDSGCIFLESENGERSPVVWPAGTSWHANPPAVELQGQLIEPGMFVEGAGGALHYERVEELAGTAVADAAEKCAGPTGEVAFFNMGSEVSVLTG